MSNTNSSKLIIAYIRCSGNKQAMDGETIERQQELIKQYCVAKGLAEPLIISDEGITGRSTKRPGYKRMLELVKQNTVDTIICVDLSRIHRSLRNMLVFLDDVILKQNINFICIKNDLVNSSTPSGRAIISILSVFNQLYADELSVKVRTAIAYKRSKNEKLGGKIPFGFTVVDKKLVPLETEQLAIKLILELRATGLTYKAIAKELRRIGYKTKAGTTQWSVKVIRSIALRNTTETKAVA